MNGTPLSTAKKEEIDFESFMKNGTLRGKNSVGKSCSKN